MWQASKRIINRDTFPRLALTRPAPHHARCPMMCARQFVILHRGYFFLSNLFERCGEMRWGEVGQGGGGLALVHVHLLLHSQQPHRLLTVNAHLPIICSRTFLWFCSSGFGFTPGPTRCCIAMHQARWLFTSCSIILTSCGYFTRHRLPKWQEGTKGILLLRLNYEWRPATSDRLSMKIMENIFLALAFFSLSSYSIYCKLRFSAEKGWVGLEKVSLVQDGFNTRKVGIQ